LKLKKNYNLLTRIKLIKQIFLLIMRDNTFVQQCLDILKREDIKSEFKMLLKPVIDFIFYEINPYIYITVGLVFLIFIMILAILIILIILLRNKQILSKLF
jgi:hypothetical protein